MPESGPLDQAVDEAFPGCEGSPVDDGWRFQLRMLRPGLNRWLDAAKRLWTFDGDD